MFRTTLDQDITTSATEILTQSKNIIQEDYNITLKELEESLTYIKTGKTPGIDEVVSELIKFLKVDEKKEILRILKCAGRTVKWTIASYIAKI